METESTSLHTFLVRLEHPDEAGWKTWVRPHAEWIFAQLAAGTIVASGPSVGTQVRQGWLLMRATSEVQLHEVLATDPFWEHGIVENLLVVEWDPIFGNLAEFSSRPDGVAG
ncbi:YciI family protein [Kocuria sp.]|uniref:YciI family protein n=1 Tax=Kocuria sp. TaxID=1871328 RepID=UPI0026DAA339|nr:YciI family protein [Kocuria sp.]MDO4918795.1 YciI family protein [Kocuria sp.]